MEGEVAIGIGFAAEARLMVAWAIQPSEGLVAAPLVDQTERLLPRSPWPLWVSDGWEAYGEALFQRHAGWQTFPRTGRPGRPKQPRQVAHPRLCYAQAVKVRDEHQRVIGVQPRVVFGQAQRSEISTWCLERQNLNLRQENRRLSRKTLAFSKSLAGLAQQLAFYQGYFNFVRAHRGLRRRAAAGGPRRWTRRTPAMAAGLTDHLWTLEQFLSHKSSLN